MSFDKYRVKAMQRFTSQLWNNLMSELNALESRSQEEIEKRVRYEDLSALAYSIVPDQDSERDLGSEASRWRRIYAYSGDFLDTLTVQGKSVLKDGDPITVSDIGDTVKDKITQAIESAHALAKLIRWGISSEPDWTFGAEITAPPANSNLLSLAIPANKTGYIFGIFLSTGEENVFRLVCPAVSVRIVMESKGTRLLISERPFCYAEGPATVFVRNVNAGSQGIVYQAGILAAII